VRALAASPAIIPTCNDPVDFFPLVLPDIADPEIAGYWTLPTDRALRTSHVESNDLISPPELEYVASGYFHHRGYTIAGGSSEIQHNIIAKHILRL